MTTPTPKKPLTLEVRSNKPLAEPILAGGAIMMTPPINDEWWLFRVKLSDEQAVVGFPKFGTIGIGFAKEDDWNTNLPYTCDTDTVTTPETKWTPEPLRVIKPTGDCHPDERGDVAIEANGKLIAEVFHHRNQRGNPGGIYVDAEPDAARLVACWNACLDMQNPVAEIAAMREALQASQYCLEQFSAERRAVQLGVPHDATIALAAISKALSGGAQ